MNDCFTIHVHQQADGSWAAHITTITGRTLTFTPVIGADKAAVLEEVLSALEIAAVFAASPLDRAHVAPDDRGCVNPPPLETPPIRRTRPLVAGEFPADPTLSEFAAEPGGPEGGDPDYAAVMRELTAFRQTRKPCGPVEEDDDSCACGCGPNRARCKRPDCRHGCRAILGLPV